MIGIVLNNCHHQPWRYIEQGFTNYIEIPIVTLVIDNTFTKYHQVLIVGFNLT